MADETYKFTIFTACFNSEKFIERLHKSIEAQTLKDFEWLIVEDCSTDNTKRILQDIQKNSDLNINLICNKKNEMISYNCNLAVRKAAGNFMIFLGHDDELVPDALEKFDQAWSNIPIYRKQQLAGMISNCQDEMGNSVGGHLSDGDFIANFFDALYKHGFHGEQCLCYLTNVLRDHNFQHFDRYIPESVLLMNISDYFDTYFVKEELRIYHTDHSSLSNDLQVSSGKVKYPLGMRYFYLEHLNKRSQKLFLYPSLFFKSLVNFTRFSMHSNISFFQSITDLQKLIFKAAVILIYPLSLILFLNDKRKN